MYAPQRKSILKSHEGNKNQCLFSSTDSLENEKKIVLTTTTLSPRQNQILQIMELKSIQETPFLGLLKDNPNADFTPIAVKTDVLSLI